MWYRTRGESGDRSRRGHGCNDRRGAARVGDGVLSTIENVTSSARWILATTNGLGQAVLGSIVNGASKPRLYAARRQGWEAASRA